jgi:hypothetical protein
MTVRLTSTAYSTRLDVDCPEMPSRTLLSCRPSKMKASPFSRKSTISQTACPCRRVRGETMAVPYQLMYSPVVTTASIPEIPSLSAGR